MGGDDLTKLAASILHARRFRNNFFPSDLFGGEQAWDILLALFVADAEGKRITGGTVIAETGGLAAPGQRWIQYLTTQTLIAGDGVGNLDDTLSLTPRGLSSLEHWLTEAKAAILA